MKISLNWLKKFINIDEPANEIAALLTGCGLEVEKTETFDVVKGGLRGLVIGRVLTCEKHPGADKLKVTTVDVGTGVLPIVCGAPNVAAGQHVIVATVGATLYPAEGDPFKISKAKIRGEVSEGMICAVDEIGLGISHDGIIVLNTELPVGTAASRYFSLDSETIFEIGLTPNRADAASHLGVARDLAAVLKRPLQPMPLLQIAHSNTSDIKVAVKDVEACPRYSYVVIDNVSVRPSPVWLQNALRSIGSVPINNIVDITNYILHHLGQPLHAFDAGRFQSDTVNVQMLPEGTTLTTLDGVPRKLAATDLVICDSNVPLCIAGVLGGHDSGISSNTTKVFLESAYFNSATIRKTSLKQNIKSEASFRFERGTDPAITLTALKQAAHLILELAGGQVVSPFNDISIGVKTHYEFDVSVSRIQKLIGKQLPKDVILPILHSLEIQAHQLDDGLYALKVPTYRVDVQREADVTEEILRIYGYNNIELPSNASAPYVAPPTKPDRDRLQQSVSDFLLPFGFFEILTNSLTKSALADLSEVGSEKITVLNALSESHDTLRQDLLNSTLEVISHNLNRQQKNLKIFEFGKTYHRSGGKYIENNKICVAITGNEHAESWQIAAQPVSLYTLKQFVLTLLNRLGINSLNIELSECSYLKNCIQINVGKTLIALLGEVLPGKLKQLDVRQPVFFAELDANALMTHYQSDLIVKEVSKYPEVRRDLSLVVLQKISFSEINEVAFRTERKLLKAVNVFDVYAGEKLKSGYKSYSVSFILQDPEQTLTDRAIDQTMSRLITGFEKELQAEIRR